MLDRRKLGSERPASLIYNAALKDISCGPVDNSALPSHRPLRANYPPKRNFNVRCACLLHSAPLEICSVGPHAVQYDPHLPRQGYGRSFVAATFGKAHCPRPEGRRSCHTGHEHLSGFVERRAQSGSPVLDIRPLQSISPDWYRLGVRPICAPTVRDLAKRTGISMVTR